MTMPELLRRPAPRRSAATPDDCVPLRRLDPAYRAVYPDGSELHIRADTTRCARRSAPSVGDADAAGFDRFLDWLEQLYETELPTFVDHNYSSPLDLAAPPRPGAPAAPARRARALGPAVDRFFTDDRLTRVFSFQALYAGVAPAEALGVLAVITYMDTVRGVFYPEGGMHAVPAALAQALTKAGVPSSTSASRSSDVLRRSDGAVVGACDRRRRAARRRRRGVHPRPAGRLRAAAARCAPRRGGAHRRATRRPPSCGTWACRGTAGSARAPPQHPLRRRLGRRLRGDHRPRRADARPVAPGHACRRSPTRPPRPDGATTCTCSSRCRTPAAGLDWRREARPDARAAARVPRGRGLPHRHREELLVTPDDWRAQGMHLGTPFALAHTFLQSGPFRPGNVDRRVPGLVFAGSGTRPGVGIPMVLVSGKLAAQRVQEYAEPPDRYRVRWSDEPPPVTPPEALAAGYAGCAQITREHGTTYYWGARLLPAEAAGTCTPSTRSAGSPTTSSTTSGRTPAADRARRWTTFGARFCVALDRRRTPTTR